MLKIIKAEEPVLVERINMCIYAQPGVGKTTLAQTAEDPLTLDFDKGIYRAPNRKDHTPVTSWSDVMSLGADDLAPYKTVVIDTAGRALDFLSADIIKNNPKAGRGDGSLTLQGFGTLKGRFATWLKTMNTYGKDVILIAHMDEQRSGDEVIERLDVQGSSKGEIYKSVDAMGRIFIRDKKRVLDFSPRENAFGKNPANLEVLEIPNVGANNYFLAGVIELIKSRMNEMSAEQQSVQKLIAEWSDAIGDMSEVEDFNRNLDGIKKAPKAAQSIFNKRATDLGYTFNKKGGIYEASNVLSV
jgi:hypothetical protein